MGRIKTYDDLLEEQKRLLSVLRSHEELIKDDITGIKAGLKPVNNVLRVVNKIATRDNRAPLMNFGVEFGVDLLIRRFLLAKAGWFTKIIVPFFIKNYSSHIIGEEQKAKLINKIRNLFQKIRPKQDPQPAAGI